MGCFLGCFGSSKDRRRRKQRHKVQPRDQQLRAPSFNVQSAVSSAEEPSPPSITPIANVQDKPEEQLSSDTRKKVTFDASVTEYEHVLVEEVTELSKQDRDCDKEEKEAQSLAKSSSSQSSSDPSSITSSTSSYPQNHRYNNCRESDDELDCEESDIDEDSDGAFSDDDFYEDAYGESRSKTPDVQLFEENVDGLVKEAVNEPVGSHQGAQDKSLYMQTVHVPVENTAQWKALKAKRTPQVKQQKENLFLDHEPPVPFSSNEPSFRQVPSISKSITEHESKRSGREVAVDASLSTWLSSEETTPVKKSSSFAFGTPDKSVSQGSNSLVSLEDRPILGALTLEEIRQFSATSSPRRSPSKSPDEMPIIGSVGSYWSLSSTTKDFGSATSFKGIPNTTSKYREDKKVNWHTTPFETRLERALNRRAAADAHSSVVNSR